MTSTEVATRPHSRAGVDTVKTPPFSRAWVHDLVLPIHWDRWSEQQRIDFLNAATKRAQDTDRATNTQLAYAYDWLEWCAYCDRLGIDRLTVEPGVFYSYARAILDRPLAPTTCERRLAGAIVGLRRQGAYVESKQGPAAGAWVLIREAQVKRVKDAGEQYPGQTPHITLPQIKAICAELDEVPYDPITGSGLRELQDKTLLLVGMYIAARRSELSQMHVRDIKVLQGLGLEITIVSKGGKIRVVAIPYEENTDLCPATTLRLWLDCIGWKGRVFRRIVSQHRPVISGMPMSPRSCGETVTRLGRLLDVDLHLTGHSLRAGRITAALEAGASLDDAAAIGGLNPAGAAARRYDRRKRTWSNPAVRISWGTEGQHERGRAVS